PSPNPATYVHNPHTWTDPLGLAPDYPKANRLDRLRGVVLDENGKPHGYEDSKGVQMVTPREIDEISASIRKTLGAPDSLKQVPGKGTVEVWELEQGNVNYRNFSSSGGKGDITIDFTGDLKEDLKFKRYHATH
ncbi:hypothetical protein L7D48_20435, partial [Streptomyces sp. S1A]|uniref:hypothetical protein n=1 Tax=Streptomyces sp. ICN903 TaxID=2964654 RepID=UPI001EDA2280